MSDDPIYQQAYALVKKYIDAPAGMDTLAAWYDLQQNLPVLKARRRHV